jgi:hypothetical protein
MHESVVHGSPSSHLLQIAPLVPQLLRLVPETQLCPSQQRPAPVQQLPAQHPPVPPEHDVPSGRGVPVHDPFWQTWVLRHSLLQATH